MLPRREGTSGHSEEGLINNGVFFGGNENVLEPDGVVF